MFVCVTSNSLGGSPRQSHDGDWLVLLLSALEIRGNHLSNTTCLIHVFFKVGE